MNYSACRTEATWENENTTANSQQLAHKIFRHSYKINVENRAIRNNLIIVTTGVLFSLLT